MKTKLKSRSQQVAEDFSDQSETQEPLDWQTFLQMYKDRMLDEEIQELGTGKNQFSMIYYAGSITMRSRENL